MLGVDAVMRGSVTKYKKHGADGQLVTVALFGFAKGSDVKADVAIYDGGDGQLIYQHNIEKAGGLFSSPDALRTTSGRPWPRTSLTRRRAKSPPGGTTMRPLQVSRLLLIGIAVSAGCTDPSTWP